MYALEKGLHMKWLAVCFCVFTMIASLGIGSTVQSNSVSTTLFEAYNIPLWVSGTLFSFGLFLVVVFGVKGIAKVCSMIVPFMAVFYVLGCIYILFVNSAYVWPAIKLIVVSAFDPSAVGGGFVGGSVMMAARYGMARGLFSNESGLGSAPIVAAAAKTRNAVRQALVSSTGTFWDTVIICALTGIVLISCVLSGNLSYDNGASLTKHAFALIPVVGTPILVLGMVFFAFTTSLGWSYYSERAYEYLFGKKNLMGFRIFYCLTCFAGAVANLALVWSFADSANALMAIPNLISLLFLSGVVVKDTRRYLWNERLDEHDTEIHH